MELDQFNTHPATIDTIGAFSKGFSGLEGFVEQRMLALAVRSAGLGKGWRG
ncbi:MAG: hypothetical protein WA116_04480 [Anaerolineaceae bacterium]